MMTFKLAFANIRKSVQDYTIYYLTIIFSAALFYAFNSLEVQTAGLDLQSRNAMQSISTIMSSMTIFLSFIFGFLLVYANNYLIRRRKKELGIYQLLGMKKTQVAQILTLEILLSSLISLVIGILLGVFLSHLLFFVTAAIMQNKITQFKFMFSSSAMAFTAMCFALMFLVVWFFTLLSVTRVKLIDLFQASRRNEDVKLRNPYIAGVIFVGAIATITWACLRLSNHKYNEFLRMTEPAFPKEFAITTGLLILGTIMLFYSFSAAYLIMAKSRKKSYFSGLNMFTVRQISSHFTSATATMVVITLLLFVTLSSLTASLGFNAYFKWMESNLFPFDMSISSAPHFREDDGSFDIYRPDGKAMSEYLKERGIYDNPEIDRTVSVQIFTPEAIAKSEDELRMSDIFQKNKLDIEKIKTGTDLSHDEYNQIMSEYFRVVPYSQYLSVCKFAKVEPVAMGNNQYLLMANFSDIYTQIVDVILQAKTPIDVRGVSLTPANDKCLKDKPAALLDTAFSTGICEGVIIVPDNLVDTNAPLYAQSEKIIIKDNADNAKFYEKLVNQVVQNAEGGSENWEWEHSIVLFNLQEYQKHILSAKLIIVYIAFYLGFVMTMTVATILSIQQLSSALDSKKSYSILKDIGVSDELCKKSLLKQISFYYILPLFVAAFYAFYAMYVLKGNLSGFIPLMIGPGELAALAGFAVVYVLYMLVTYQMSKRIIAQK